MTCGSRSVNIKTSIEFLGSMEAEFVYICFIELWHYILP